MRVVISQSMLFPWIGMLEQIRLADVFVHYDDVQFSKGSFVNRVQIKTPAGTRWMTVPLKDLRLGQRIDEVQFAPPALWRAQHLELLASSFEGAPFAKDALDIAETVYSGDYQALGALARASLRALTQYFGLDGTTRFLDVVNLEVTGSSSTRVLDVVKKLGGDTYITGHGAAKYLDHALFERNHVKVEYIHYSMKPYSQLHGTFTPYVSGLDLVANCGREGAQYICSNTISWRDFTDESSRSV